MTYGTMEKIETVTVTAAGGQAAIEFLNIPQTYDDLYFVFSCRENVAQVGSYLVGSFNSNTSSYSTRELIGDGSNAGSNTYTTGAASRLMGYTTGNNATASTFGNSSLYIPNYRGSTNKSWSVDGVSENNATTSVQVLLAGLWSNTAAITSVSFTAFNGNNWMQHSTATLYGITRVPAGAKATGGVIYDDASYWYHVFTSSGTFTPSASLSADILVIAGGGGGASTGVSTAAGGGAGGLLAHTAQALTAQNYTVTVGAGGTGATGGVSGGSGNNSQFASLTASVGGGGGQASTALNGISGGSGGGAFSLVANPRTGGTATSGQGNRGGNATGDYAAGGGGGAGGAGGDSTANNTGANGGAGSSAYSSWATATSTGVSGVYAGGGASGTGFTPNGGGGAMGVRGVANTGAGGGGGGFGQSSNAGAGGSGIVIVRYAK